MTFTHKKRSTSVHHEAAEVYMVRKAYLLQLNDKEDCSLAEETRLSMLRSQMLCPLSHDAIVWIM